MSEIKRAEFIVSGHVQGVGFRYFVFSKAAKLNLSGFAKNLYNGTVEVIAEGEEENIRLLHNYLLTGPSRSRVDKCQVTYRNPNFEKNGFSIK